MSARRPIAKDTRDKQRIASDPKLSAWVSAHAGAGKTHVLASRVVRLLLSRVPPSRILCLTYTKAAAANMAARIFDILAKWSLLDDESLAKAIVATGAGPPSAGDLVFARRLFARTVETPGGLKIQTIHAFCERVLHLFPFEANVAASFRVLEEMERVELLARARRQTLERAVCDAGELHAALGYVAQLTSLGGFDELIRELLCHRESLRGFASREDYAADLRAALELGEGEILATIEREIIEGGIAHWQWLALAACLRQGGANDARLADRLQQAASLAPHPSCIDAYLAVFFTQKGAPRGDGDVKIISKNLQKKEPLLLARLENERDRLARLLDKRKGLAAFERSLALAAIGDAILSGYEHMKSNRGLYDFDDLIERTRNLLQRSSPSWVLYKLDQAIDHILVDEAQDTSAAQWDILATLAGEFCAGAGAGKPTRTLFAVGDEKQSIFSFQGAAPEKFDRMRREFAGAFRQVEHDFQHVRLTRSFRSVPDVLNAIDAVFKAGDNRRGLSADPAEPAPEHEAWKADVAGLVEIWDLIGADRVEPPRDWRLPLDYVGDANPASTLARKIARKIKALLARASGECVEDCGALRAIEPGDIMILVRKRDAFFEAMIRALKGEHIAVAGADRLDLTGHIAVMDLVAAGRAALLGADDLTLATVLKSPLVGLTDDDLIELAPKRQGSLYNALANSSAPAHQAAAAQIAGWTRNASVLAPFDFYSLILGPEGGRAKFVARLGAEANDALDEFLRLALAFEREQAPSLTVFLDSVEDLDIPVKRDMEGASGAVRVMTVHAAKGLEAKIVFLPDTCGAPSGRHDPQIFALGGEAAPALAWSMNMGADPPAIARARDRLREAARDEHRRLLYVALTRAEERLYVAGFHGPKGSASGCWYEMIRDALESSCLSFDDPENPGARLLRRGAGVPERLSAPPAQALASLDIPAFARAPAAKEFAPAPPLRPSTALAWADAPPADAAAAPTWPESERLLVGRLTHA
ncbi:MAG: double-strand break repair helicase AddA, partial [Methylocystis sp.]|nr:double-strand break repair helicase AddA [Methylocystis sp.]